MIPPSFLPFCEWLYSTDVFHAVHYGGRKRYLCWIPHQDKERRKIQTRSPLFLPAFYMKKWFRRNLPLHSPEIETFYSFFLGGREEEEEGALPRRTGNRDATGAAAQEFRIFELSRQSFYGKVWKCIAAKNKIESHHIAGKVKRRGGPKWVKIRHRRYIKQTATPPN